MNWTETEEKIREEVRLKRGSQAEISRRLGIRPPSVSAYISGENNIPPEHLDTILEVIGKDLRLEDKT